MNNFRKIIRIIIPSIWYCYISGIRYRKGWQIRGRIRIIKNNFLSNKRNGLLKIGKDFKCNNTIKSNTIGVFQPCIFNISFPKSKIIIGDNVGISGSSICACESVIIGNNVLIGSGCLITDTDSHPVDWNDRRENNNDKKGISPVKICDDVFIGARSIILKGVTIGERSVVGAGSVVSKDVPPDCIVAGNPAKVVRFLKQEDGHENKYRQPKDLKC